MDSTLFETSDGPDDRVTCVTCRNLIPWSGKCREDERHGAVVKALPRRCVMYVPLAREIDQRPGRERWPDLDAEILEVRAMDQAYAKALA